MRSGIAVDTVESLMEVVGRVGGGDDLVTGPNFDGTAAADRPDEHSINRVGFPVPGSRS